MFRISVFAKLYGYVCTCILLQLVCGQFLKRKNSTCYLNYLLKILQRYDKKQGKRDKL